MPELLLRQASAPSMVVASFGWDRPVSRLAWKNVELDVHAVEF
jgi:hypothetical protein